MAENTLLKIDNFGKTFYGNAALIDISININCGEIVGLVGENGAGKSTLLKIIMGVQPQTCGTMQLNGIDFCPKDPKEANLQGVGMVFQEQSLITNLTVAQNIFLGKEKQFITGGLINYKKMNDAAADILTNVNLIDVKPNQYVRDYKFAARQMVEIGKVINQAYSSSIGHALILLDEPTSVLNENEINQLFKEMRKLADNGHSIIFVSHRLDEVLEISDRIYVFKDARLVGEFVADQVDERILYETMVGKESSNEYYFTHLQKESQKEVVLEVKDLGLFGTFKDLSFKLHRGEVLGLYGVIGSGKEDVCSVLCGDIEPTSGEILIQGKKARFKNPNEAMKKGIIMLPQERNIEGVVGVLSVADNISISSFQHLGKLGFITPKSITKQADEWILNLRIKTPDSKTSVNNLSGGNSQKVLFARILSSKSEIVILNHPTRGVDVGAKEEIYHLIRTMIDQGKSIIMLGDTLDETIGMCNRILVMKDGLVSGEFFANVDNKPKKIDIIQCMM